MKVVHLQLEEESKDKKVKSNEKLEHTSFKVLCDKTKVRIRRLQRATVSLNKSSKAKARLSKMDMSHISKRNMCWSNFKVLF